LRHLVWQSSFSIDQISGNRSSSSTSCRNTVQGKKLLCDDAGFVCSRDELLSSGCCPVQNSRFVCHSCQNNTQCCTKYEICVSCCLRPQNKDVLSSFVMNTISSLERLFGSIGDQFELCLSKCRTSSLSVQHENTYRDSEYKYCFGSNPPRLRL
jgi:hypothetical protein